MDEQAYKDEIGRRLRAVRHQQELTLDQVEIRTEGRFTAVAVASWERGDRTISAAKLLRLAAFYGVPAGELLSDLDRSSSRSSRPAGGGDPGPATVDLDRLRKANVPGGKVVGRYVDHIRQMRGDSSLRITLRGDDVRKLSALLGVTPEACRAVLAALDVADRPGAGHQDVAGDEPHVVIHLDRAASLSRRDT